MMQEASVGSVAVVVAAREHSEEGLVLSPPATSLCRGTTPRLSSPPEAKEEEADEDEDEDEEDEGKEDSGKRQ